MTVIEERAQVAGPERIADRLYHELLAPEETQSVRAAVRRIAEHEVAPHAAAIAGGDERTDGFPRRCSTRLPAGSSGSPSPPRSAATG